MSPVCIALSRTANAAHCSCRVCASVAFRFSTLKLYARAIDSNPSLPLRFTRSFHHFQNFYEQLSRHEQRSLFPSSTVLLTRVLRARKRVHEFISDDFFIWACRLAARSPRLFLLTFVDSSNSHNKRGTCRAISLPDEKKLHFLFL